MQAGNWHCSWPRSYARFLHDGGSRDWCPMGASAVQHFLDLRPALFGSSVAQRTREELRLIAAYLEERPATRAGFQGTFAASGTRCRCGQPRGQGGCSSNRSCRRYYELGGGHRCCHSLMVRA